MGGKNSVPEEVKAMKTNRNAVFEVLVEYCGSWGYSSMAEYARQCITEVYPQAKVEGKRIPGSTGIFDVSVGGKDGQV